MSARDTAREAKVLAIVERRVERQLGLKADGFAAADACLRAVVKTSRRSRSCR